MARSIKRNIFLVLGLLIALAVLYGVQYSAQTFGPAQAQSSGDVLSGYAWTETVGWICFNQAVYCPSARVSVSGSGTLSGYGWSENIGWVQFGGLSGFPTGGGTQAVNAQLSGNSIIGWARALANGGGWDGWISLDGTNYGLTISGDQVSGYAWGDEVVGWVDFSGVSFAPQDICTDISGNQGSVPPGCVLPNPVPGACVPDGYSYNGAECVVTPSTIDSFEANPSRVRNGETSTLSWEVSAPPESCSITGTDGFSYNVASTSLPNGSVETDGISQTIVFTLTCAGETADVTVGVSPQFQ